MPYSFLDHTADTGIIATGDDTAQAFAAAAEGLAASLCDPEGVHEREQRSITVEAPDRESLLVDFLSEINYRFEVDRFAFRRFTVAALTGTRIEATGYGEPLDSARHNLGPQVKAVTYHALEIMESPEGCRVQVILDV